MGVKISAYFKNNYATFKQIEELKELLEQTWESQKKEHAKLEWLLVYYENLREHYEKGGFLILKGFQDTLIHINSDLLEVVTLWDWEFFSSDITTRESVNDYFSVFAKVLGPAIYLPDSEGYSNYIFEQKKYSDLTEDLHSRFGEPVQKASQLVKIQSGFWKTNGYYLEKFDSK